MKRRRTLYLAVGVFLLGIATTAVGFYVRHRRQKELSVTAFSMSSTYQIFKVGVSKPLLNARIKRLQRSDGTWKEMTTYYSESGATEGQTTILGITGRGVFKINDEKQRLFFLSPKYHAVHEVNAEQMRSSGQFVRDDVLLGYPVVVQRTPGGDGGFTEFFLAPSLGGTLLREMDRNRDGSFALIDADEITLGEPTDADFGPVPNYVVDYTVYERFIRDAGTNGQVDLARKMQLVLDQQKSDAKSK